MKAVVEHVRGVGVQDVLLITPGPVCESARVQHNQRVRRNLNQTSCPILAPFSPFAGSLRDANASVRETSSVHVFTAVG